MKQAQISDGSIPLGKLKAEAAKFLMKRPGESGEPMVITQNGRIEPRKRRSNGGRPALPAHGSRQSLWKRQPPRVSDGA